MSGRRIGILDFGGQYAHLIASRIRRLGALAVIVDPETLAPKDLPGEFAGLVYSGGPSSVYDAGAPACDPALLSSGIPVLGICYGHQLMMHQLGGKVVAGSPEFGRANLIVEKPEAILAGESGRAAAVWMSHGDEVVSLPEGFETIAHTDDCRFAAVWNPAKRLVAVQFHPEVTHTEHGDNYLRNFINLCGVADSYSLRDFLSSEEAAIRIQTAGRSVFFLLSGGVDSTVAFSVLSRVLPPERLYGLYVNTGFMRKGESEEVKAALGAHGIELHVEDASERYFAKLAGVTDPEKKRAIIGDLFLEIQAEVSARLGLDPEHWILGQGTIYPDTIESGGTKKSHLIKTHHNQIPAIQLLIEQGRIVEPIRDLYKDEVRAVGQLLELPRHLVFRHPFPGPGLAIRCLCSSESSGQFRAVQASGDLHVRLSAFGAQILPLKSVGVQGDQRTYAHPAVLKAPDPMACMRDQAQVQDLARMLPNAIREINRVLLFLAGDYPSVLRAADLSRERTERLRDADAIVTDFLHEKKIYDEIWQFPVVLAPLSRPARDEDAVILRPVVSEDAMTVAPYFMAPEFLRELCSLLLSVPGLGSVFFDLTTKPPGTIEWE